MNGSRLPNTGHLDATLSLLLDPYWFISAQRDRIGSSVFQTRLLLEPTICMVGAEAARLFYDERFFQREGAMPGRIRKTLLGECGVQGLDDAPHRHRKAMFMRIMTERNIGRLREIAMEEWARVAALWSGRQVVLYDEARVVLCRAACRWAGIPLEPDEERGRINKITALFQHAGSIGFKHYCARHARRQCEAWASEVIAAFRDSMLDLPEDQPAAIVALHRDAEGNLSQDHVPAVELLNIVRPITAIAVFVAHLGHAIASHNLVPSLLETEEGRRAFVQETRRFYPFFPAVAARVRQEFEWQGYDFPRGRRVLLDLYGTNHDPGIWDRPDEFMPQRSLHGRRHCLTSCRRAAETICLDIVVPVRRRQLRTLPLDAQLTNPIRTGPSDRHAGHSCTS